MWYGSWEGLISAKSNNGSVLKAGKMERGPHKTLRLHSTQQVPGYTQPDHVNQDINQYSTQTKQRIITSSQNESVNERWLEQLSSCNHLLIRMLFKSCMPFFSLLSKQRRLAKAALFHKIKVKWKNKKSLYNLNFNILFIKNVYFWMSSYFILFEFQ